MIIIRLTGGLGNQLFQYAFARSLSYNLDVELFLHISRFSHNEKPKHAIFGLHSYNIKGLVGYYPYVEKTDVGINQNESKNLTKYVERFVFPNWIFEYGVPNWIFEYDVVKTIENIQLPAYFKGWFQNQIKNKKNSYITENFFKINNKLIHEY